MIQMKKRSTLPAMLMLMLLVFTSPSALAQEVAAYTETLLQVPEGSRLYAMVGEPDDAILAVAADAAGEYQFLRWRDLNAPPEVLPLFAGDMAVSAMNVDIAPDGEVGLLVTGEETDASGMLSIVTTVTWMDVSGQKSGETALFDMLMNTKVLSKRRVAGITFGSEVVVYSETGEVLMRESVMGASALSADQDTLYVFASGMVYSWDLETYTQQESRPISIFASGEITLDKDGTMYFISVIGNATNGIHRLDLETGEAHLIMASIGTCLGEPSFSVKGFAPLSDGTFVLLANNFNANDAELHLRENNYIAAYRARTDIQDRTPFVINALGSNAFLQKAASEYQKLHPELLVDLRVMTMRPETAMLPREDKIRLMNTELLAGNGGDVLVLDYLPADALVERGMLQDISHIAQEIRFVDGISQTMAAGDGRVYAIPVEFGVFLLWGQPDAIASVHSLMDVMAAELEPGQMRLPMGTDLYLLYSVCRPEFTDENGDILFESEAFIDFLNLLATAYAEIEQEAAGIPAPERVRLDRSVAKDGAIAFYPIDGRWMADIDIMPYYHGPESIGIRLPSLYGGSTMYKPGLLLSIPSDAENPALAEAFIRFVLDENTVLPRIYYVGFPTVATKLEAMFDERIAMANDPFFSKGYLQEEGGVRVIDAPTEAFYQNLRTLLQDVSVPAKEDATMFAFIQEELMPLVAGTRSAEETARAIQQRAFIYLSE